MKKSPGLLSQKCIIEKGEIFKPHASLSFWLAQIQPLHLMNFAIIPKKIYESSFRSHYKVK